MIVTGDTEVDTRIVEKAKEKEVIIISTPMIPLQHQG